MSENFEEVMEKAKAMLKESIADNLKQAEVEAKKNYLMLL